MALVFILGALLLRYSRFGINVYAIGGNQEAARLVGIPVKRRLFGVYVLSGVLAALSGLLITARLWSAQPQVGTGIELDAIAAAVLGASASSAAWAIWAAHWLVLLSSVFSATASICCAFLRILS
jgi:ribose transport system permease protein